MDKKRFVSLLLEWYYENKRDLPWRKTKDPYKIWLSEIMLQQTRVNQGIPYYKKILKIFSSVKKLASAPEKKILRLWQGLGYYSRARNLHRCAKIVSSQFNGKFPNTYSQLLSLPGIGEYTAAAISSIAFNEQKAVVDGNVFRVLARLKGVGLNINTPAGKRYFFELANSIIPENDPGLFNQAIMEFGALFCTPKNPRCTECVFKKQCIAFQTGNMLLYPVKRKQAKRKRRYFNYLVIKARGKYWMHERKANDIWKGLHEFYLLESDRPLSDREAIRLLSKRLGIVKFDFNKSVRLKQILSHQEIIAKFFELKVIDGPLLTDGGKFYGKRDLDRIAKPVLITKYLDEMAIKKFYTQP